MGDNRGNPMGAWSILQKEPLLDVYLLHVVTPVGLEPTRLATSDPKSDLATNYNRGPIFVDQPGLEPGTY